MRHIVISILVLFLFSSHVVVSASVIGSTAVLQSGDSNSHTDDSPTEIIRQHFIPWRFSVYADPAFEAELVAGFPPQYVNILHENGDGWVLISTADGNYWTFITANRRYISRPVGIFRNSGDTSHECILSPQTVTILEQDSRWLLIETWLGERWIYLDFQPPTDNLDLLLGRFEGSMAIYYKNLETGFTYSRNADRMFFSASVPKAPFALYIFDLAEQGQVDLNSTVIVQASDFHQSLGSIRHRRNAGTPVSQQTLLEWMVSYSDGMATSMLRRTHNQEHYRQFLMELGVPSNNVGGTLLHSRFTASNAGLYAEAIFNYIESDGTYSNLFREMIFNNQYPFIISDHPVASKTGWTRGLAWHDMAIVDAPSPYILVILTQRQGWSERDYQDFAEISKAFQAFNDTWFLQR